MRSRYPYNYPLACLCNISSILNASFASRNVNPFANNFSSPSSSRYSCYNCITPKRYTFLSTSSLKTNYTFPSTSSLKTNYTSTPSDESNLPNKALLSFIILFGTCLISVALKRFRRSNFFGRTVS